jgi:hypothetical protein
MSYDLTPWSRFKETARIVYNNNPTFGLWSRPQVFDNINESNVTKYQVESGESGRPDLIALKFYGSDVYDWIIIMYNQPLNPIGWPKQGDVISIPVRSAIVDLL